jgi:polyribonucleotide 5'-hydroxyl-kinase
MNLQLRTYMYGYKLPLLPGLDEKELGGEGRVDMTLAPHSTHIGFDDLKIYRIGEQSIAPSSALPIGAQRSISETQPILIDPSLPGSGLLNAVLALLATPQDQGEHYDEQVLDLDVMGFLVV